MKAIVLSLLCSLMLATGQICWKLSMMNRELAFSLKSFFGLAIKPLFLAGVALYGLATVLWIYLLSKYELSYIYPMIAFAYVFGVLLSVVILKETVSLTRLGGVMLVVIGVAVIGISK
jgi:drug/metabolite transporter (DMT)-like permease